MTFFWEAFPGIAAIVLSAGAQAFVWWKKRQPVTRTTDDRPTRAFMRSDADVAMAAASAAASATLAAATVAGTHKAQNDRRRVISAAKLQKEHARHYSVAVRPIERRPQA